MLQNLRRKILTQGLLLSSHVQTELALRLSRKPTLPLPIPSSNYYTSLTELPLNRFLIFYIDGDKNALIRGGEVMFHGEHRSVVGVKGVEGLGKLPDTLLQEYFDLSGGKDNAAYMMQLVALTKAQSRMDRAIEIVKSLMMQPNDELLKELKKIGLNNPDNIESWCKTQQLKIEKLEKEMRPKSNEKPTYQLFDSILAEIDPMLDDSISTYRFCTLYNKLKQKAKSAEKQHGRR